jgi:hypothetical protein
MPRYACAHVSRNEDANSRLAVVSRGATIEQVAEDAEGPAESGSCATASPFIPPGASVLADECARARLISEIARLIREPTVPEGTRVAGLTLIGWLARRRPEEAPHAIGVEEARKSERCMQAARVKAR